MLFSPSELSYVEAFLLKRWPGLQRAYLGRASKDPPFQVFTGSEGAAYHVPFLCYNVFTHALSLRTIHRMR